VGWHLRRELSHHRALRTLQPAGVTLGQSDGVLHRSDRGSQSCCHALLRALAEQRGLPSMTDANHGYQKALAERVNGILKDEVALDAIFPTCIDAHAAVARAVHAYNTRRLHGSLQRQTPHAGVRPSRLIPAGSQSCTQNLGRDTIPFNRTVPLPPHRTRTAEPLQLRASPATPSRLSRSRAFAFLQFTLGV
jgi:hypothetical protein